MLSIWHLLQARSSLTFRQTIECEFSLELVRDMLIKYNLKLVASIKDASHFVACFDKSFNSLSNKKLIFILYCLTIKQNLLKKIILGLLLLVIVILNHVSKVSVLMFFSYLQKYFMWLLDLKKMPKNDERFPQIQS